jgi:hypothetical protein
VTKKQALATEAQPTQPTAADKPAKPKKAKSKSKKVAVAAIRGDALLGKTFTHRTRREWGVGTVVDGADNAIVLAWSDGTERRTARSYMDQLIEVPQ